MNETPLPFHRVGDDDLRPVGHVAQPRERRAERGEIDGRRSVPRASRTPRTCAARSPRSLTDATQVSDWILLWSTITVISPMLAVDAAVPATPRSGLPAARRRRSSRRCGRSRPGQAVGVDHPLGLRDPHAERAGVGRPCRACRRRDGPAARRAGAAVQQLERRAARGRSAPRRGPGASWPLDEK